MLLTAHAFRSGVLLACCSVTIAGCNQPAAPTVDRAAIEAALRKTDAAWGETVKSKSVDGWLGFYAPDAMVLPPNEKVSTSREAARASIAGLFALPGVTLTWHPVKVDIAQAGDLAYLTGPYEMSFNDPVGKAVHDTGKFVEVWKVQSDGSWKCVVDAWNSDLPATP